MDIEEKNKMGYSRVGNWIRRREKYAFCKENGICTSSTCNEKAKYNRLQCERHLELARKSYHKTRAKRMNPQTNMVKEIKEIKKRLKEMKRRK